MTMRSIEELNTLLADNITGDISPSDMRDVVDSLKVRCGSMYITSPVETVISAVDTLTKVLGATTLIAPVLDFSMSENNRLLYGGIRAVFANIICPYTITSVSSNVDTALYIAKNGAVVDSSKGPRKIGSGSDKGRGTVGGTMTLNPGDYVELWVENLSDDSNLTVENMTFMCTAFVQ